MALPKVSPGQYNYGAYANPKQVKLADTSAIGAGLMKAAESVAKGYTKKKDREFAQQEQLRREKRADEIREETREATFAQQEKMAKLSSGLTEGRQIRAEQRAKKEEEEEILDKQIQIGLKADQLFAAQISKGTMQSFAEDVGNETDPNLKAVKAELFEDIIQIHGMAKNFAVSSALENVSPDQILTRKGKMLAGLKYSINKGIVAITPDDETNMGGRFVFKTFTGNKDSRGNEIMKEVSLMPNELQALLEGMDEHVKLKHAIGTTEEDLLALGGIKESVKNIVSNNPLEKTPDLYIQNDKGENVIDDGRLTSLIRQQPTLMNQITRTKSARDYYMTVAGGEYDPNNKEHQDIVIQDYIQHALGDIRGEVPELLQAQEKTESTGLPSDHETKRENETAAQFDKRQDENYLNLVLKNAMRGDLSVIQGIDPELGGFAFKNGVYIDPDDDDVTFTPAQLIDQLSSRLGKKLPMYIEAELFKTQ